MNERPAIKSDIKLHHYLDVLLRGITVGIKSTAAFYHHLCWLCQFDQQNYPQSYQIFTNNGLHLTANDGTPLFLQNGKVGHSMFSNMSVNIHDIISVNGSTSHFKDPLVYTCLSSNKLDHFSLTYSDLPTFKTPTRLP